MRDYELGEVVAGTKPREKHEDADHEHHHVAEAIKTGRGDKLGPRGAVHLQRAAGNSAATSLLQRQEQESPVKDVVRGSGTPLDKGLRQEMEGQFGADFSDVKVHTGAGASSSAKAVQAHAYTVGNNVVLGDGVDPGSDKGKHTIAHELTHVVQQRNGPVDGTSAGGGIKLSSPGDRFEREAESTADRVMAGQGAGNLAGTNTHAQAEFIQRKEEQSSLQRMADVQRQGEDEDKDAAQGQFVQREAGGEEDKEAEQPQFIQREAGGEEDKEAEQPQSIQREAGGEEDKEAEQPQFIQREAGGEEDKEAEQPQFIQREAEGGDEEMAE